MSESVGFSGTRRHLIHADERIRVAQIIRALPEDTRIITGGCTGVDAFVADYAKACGYQVHTIMPANRSQVDPRWKAHCTTFEEMSKGTDYRDRNQRIVDLSDRLIAIPDHDEHAPESRRSGTWQTFRLARKAGRKVEVHVLCADCDPSRRQPRQEASDA